MPVRKFFRTLIRCRTARVLSLRQSRGFTHPRKCLRTPFESIEAARDARCKTRANPGTSGAWGGERVGVTVRSDCKLHPLSRGTWGANSANTES